MKKMFSEELHPMKVTPSNFTKGDVVKKIFMDNIQTPYVGVVTSVIPSTNKLEVQWPHGMGMEDPWDLIKVNPLINPPVVKEDRAYKTYQNQKAQKYNEDYCEGLKHYNVIDDYVQENILPVITRASKFYDKGYSKRESFQRMAKDCDNYRILTNVLNRLFNAKVNIKRSNIITVDGICKEADIIFQGDCDNGFKVSYRLGSRTEEKIFESYKKALETFKHYEGILESIDSKKDLNLIVAHVNRIRKYSENDINLGKED